VTAGLVHPFRSADPCTGACRLKQGVASALMRRRRQAKIGAAVGVRITWCRSHRNCSFTVEIWGAELILARARSLGFDVHPLSQERYIGPCPDPIRTLIEHIREHGTIRVAWLSGRQRGWLVHSARVSLAGPLSDPDLEVVLRSATASEHPSREEATRRLAELTQSGAVLWRPSDERASRASTVPLELSDWDAARLLRRLGHPMSGMILARLRSCVRARLSHQTDLLRSLEQLVLAVIARPDSRPARKLDMAFSDPSTETRNAMEVLHTVAALCLGESCQEICTLVEIQREVYRSSGSAVRSLVVAATPHLAVATALELMSRP
jgi:hypothetical protein